MIAGVIVRDRRHRHAAAKEFLGERRIGAEAHQLVGRRVPGGQRDLQVDEDLIRVV